MSEDFQWARSFAEANVELANGLPVGYFERERQRKAAAEAVPRYEVLAAMTPKQWEAWRKRQEKA